VRAEMRGLNTPVEISAANVYFNADTLSMQQISAHTANTHWSGSITTPRHCNATDNANAATDGVFGTGAFPNCIFHFNLAADQFSAADLAQWFTSHPAKRPWYRILKSDSDSSDARLRSPLLSLQAQGNLQVGRFALKKVIATQIATHVEVDRGKITLSALRAQLLQGSHQGNWTLDVSNHDISNHDVSNRDPSNHDATSHDASATGIRYRGAGTLRDISLSQVATLMNDAWITGTADGKFDLDGSTDSFRGLLSGSEGRLQFVVHNGSLPHIEIPGSPAPLPVHRFTGELHLKKSAWELSAGKLESRDGLYQVSGTISESNDCDFVLQRGDEQSWELTGPLSDPSIAPANGTVAKRSETPANQP
jgi:hypothetical protein